MKAKARLLMALKIWMVIYPSITLFLFLFGQVLSTFPLYQRTFILTISLVPWMMFIGIPLLDGLIRLFSGRYFYEQIKNKNEKEKSI
jgi:antibiotic biosynthesis monooxygenase (ABM) superfamily enzyme